MTIKPPMLNGHAAHRFRFYPKPQAQAHRPDFTHPRQRGFLDYERLLNKHEQNQHADLTSMHSTRLQRLTEKEDLDDAAVVDEMIMVMRMMRRMRMMMESFRKPLQGLKALGNPDWDTKP